jgi:hypothetical protein
MPNYQAVVKTKKTRKSPRESANKGRKTHRG